MPRRRSKKIRICEWCGHLISPDRGPASKTCSPECQRDRNNTKEKKRYHKVKDTEEWKATRAEYLDRLKQRIDSDPVLKTRLEEQHRQAQRKFREALEQDPARLEAYREAQREWHRNLSPARKAERKYWYGNLSKEDRQVFLLSLRKRRAAERAGNAEDD